MTGAMSMIREVVRFHFDTIDGDRIHHQGHISIRDGLFGCSLIRGWCFAQKAKRPLCGLLVTLEGTQGRFELDHEYGLVRPDVAAAHGSASLTECGLEMFVSPNVPPGEYKLFIKGNTTDGETISSTGIDVHVL